VAGEISTCLLMSTSPDESLAPYLSVVTDLGAFLQQHVAVF